MFGSLFKNIFNGPKDEKGDNIDFYKCVDKIKVLESKIIELQTINDDLKKQLDYTQKKEVEYQKILCNFDKLLRQAIIEKNNSTENQDATRYHLANLEKAFYDLLQKYEKAKAIIQGFQHNEGILKHQLGQYEKILNAARQNANASANANTKPASKKKDDNTSRRSFS